MSQALPMYAPLFSVEYPLKAERGRDVRAGHLRGWGIEFGELIQQRLTSDDVWQRALDAANRRGTLVTLPKLANIYLIMRYALAREERLDVMEFGSFRGGSAVFMATVLKALGRRGRVYALDTYQGMPPTDPLMDLHGEGDFKDCDFEGFLSFIERDDLKDHIVVVKGRFDQTLPGLLAARPQVALAHCDCDVYEGVKYVCRMSPQFMRPGGFVVFDDPLHGSCLGAFTAVEEEYVRRQGLLAEQAYPHLVYRMQPLAS